MGVIKNDVGRPSNKTLKIRMILRLILVLIAVALIVGVGYFISNKKNEETNTNVSEKENISIDDAEEILYSVFDDFMYFDTETFNSEEYKTYIAIKKTNPKTTNYTCKDIFKENITKYDSDESDNMWEVTYEGESYICRDEDQKEGYSYEDVNETYKKYFGENKAAIKSLAKYNFMEFYSYIEDKNIYTHLTKIAGDGGHEPLYGITDAYQKDNFVYINFVYADVGYDFDFWSMELNDKTTVTLTSNQMNNKKTYKQYQDKMNKYEFIFKKDGKNYIFNEVKEVK